jgi:integrase
VKRTLLYTTPRLVKGRKPTNIPKGSTLDKEWAKNKWHIEYFFNGERIRQTDNINRIKDAVEKKERAENILEAIKDELKNGYNPENPEAYLEKQRAANINLKDAVNEYLAEKGSYLRGKSVGSYGSKLRYLVEAFPDHKVKEITAKHIEGYIYNKIHKGEPAVINMKGKVIPTSKITKWTPATVKAARNYFRGFFNWCMDEAQGYITENPIGKVNNRKIRSEVKAEERHVPYTREDAQTLLAYLNKHDKFSALFCLMIYYTCLRPSELVSLQLFHINLTDGIITVPLSGMKNTQKDEPDTVHIDLELLPHLEALNLHTYPRYFYLFSNDYKNIVGEKSAGHNRPYKKWKKAMEKLNLIGKGYTQYGFKHTANVQRLLSNEWTKAEMKLANRHSTFDMTENYIAKMNKVMGKVTKSTPAI